MTGSSLLNITDPTVRQQPPGQTRPYPEPTRTGTAPFTLPNTSLTSETWYAIHGDLSSSQVPLIALHGGPGCGHNYLKTLALLSTGSPYARPVIFYDQMGCGKSTHLRDKRLDSDFWTPELFMAELDNLVKHLAIERFDLLGQSWGGMLGAQYASTQPKGLRKLVICDSPADMGTWVAVANELRALLPKHVQETLTRCEEEGKTDSNEYEVAVLEFYKLFVCRVQPFPKEFNETMDNLKDDDTVYFTMNGPSEFHVIGSLKTWDVRPDLHKIQVPTLLVNGKFDEAQDSTMQAYFDGIKSAVKWVRFAESSHMPHLEETGDFIMAVGRFLDG